MKDENVIRISPLGQDAQLVIERCRFDIPEGTTIHFDGEEGDYGEVSIQYNEFIHGGPADG